MSKSGLAKLRGAFLTKLLIDAGHLHLHHPAMGTHPTLLPPEPPAGPAERLEELAVPF